MHKNKLLAIALLTSLSVIGFNSPGEAYKNNNYYHHNSGEYNYHNRGPGYHQRSSYSEDTKKIQLRLIELGYNPGAADGIMGGRTYSAIKQFQRDNGLVPDGIVGYQTRQKLNL